MAIPLGYSVRSVAVRWPSAVVAVLGIAGTVGVFVAMLSLARGFKATLVASGSAGNALIRRAGSTAELDGAIGLDQVRVIQDAPGIARAGDGPLLSPEIVTNASFPLNATGTDALVQLRGVSPRALQVRNNIKITAGRFLSPGLNELVAGKNASYAYRGFTLGNTVRFSGATWRVVGIFDAGGSAFDSEIWADAAVLSQVFQRPLNLFNSVTVRLSSPEALPVFAAALNADPRLTVRVDREIDYYEQQSRTLSMLIAVLGSIVAVVMAVGAVFGALNTMYSAVAERSREIATMRALGFGSGSVVLAFLFESLSIALVGGVLGCLAVLPINGYTTGSLNFQTWSHVSFAFRVTPDLLLGGIGFALLMGIVGGVPPAVRAARSPIAATLRAL